MSDQNIKTESQTWLSGSVGKCDEFEDDVEYSVRTKAFFGIHHALVWKTLYEADGMELLWKWKGNLAGQVSFSQAKHLKIVESIDGFLLYGTEVTCDDDLTAQRADLWNYRSFSFFPPFFLVVLF